MVTYRVGPASERPQRFLTALACYGRVGAVADIGLSNLTPLPKPRPASTLVTTGIYSARWPPVICDVEAVHVTVGGRLHAITCMAA